MREGWDTAQVCENGHDINAYAASMPQYNAPRCSKCGAETITKCSKCSEIIRGKYHASGVIDVNHYKIPSFCHNCGSPYPWTDKQLSAAREYVRESERLTDNEKGILERSLDDLVRDTPNTPISVLRYKQLVSKMGAAAAEGLKTILFGLLTEAAKRQIWPH